MRLIHNMPPSHLTKFVATYATAFWRKAGFSGDMARSSCEGVCESNPVAITFDATTSTGNPAILGFITSYAAAKWSSVKVYSSFGKGCPKESQKANVRILKGSLTRN